MSDRLLKEFVRTKSDKLLGTITFLNEHEAANASRTNDSVIDRPWELWRKRAKEKG